jgi:hypothetical protein
MLIDSHIVIYAVEPNYPSVRHFIAQLFLTQRRKDAEEI